jgi:hypothetical protein
MTVVFFAGAVDHLCSFVGILSMLRWLVDGNMVEFGCGAVQDLGCGDFI